MKETSKLNWYRKDKGYDKYFIGKGIDIGCGDDPLDIKIWDNVTDLLPYDFSSTTDAQTLADLDDNSFDFVYSSHCLEDMEDPYKALSHWLRVLKPEGHLVVAVPDEEFYERLIWPSLFNPNHKHSFRHHDADSPLPCSISVPNMLKDFSDCLELVAFDRITKNFDAKKRIQEDQTLKDAVCQIEFVVKKRAKKINIKTFKHQERDIDSVPPYKHNVKMSIVLSYSALGDYICALPAIKRMIEEDRLYKVLTYPNRLPILQTAGIPDSYVHTMNEYQPMPFNPMGSLVRDILEHADITAPFNIHLQDYASFNCCSAMLRPEHKNIPLASPDLLPDNPYKGTKYAIVSPTYMLKSRCMSPKIFNELKLYVKDTLGLDLIVLGGDTSPHRTISGEEEYDFSDCTYLVNKTSLLESLSIIKDAEFLVTMDSGLVYLAAMTDVPIVAGYTIVDPFYRLPWRHNELGWNCAAVEPRNDCKYCTGNIGAYRSYDVVCPNFSDFKCSRSFDSTDFISAITKLVTLS
jgi:SAM-dependent methyltransferase